MCKDFLMIGGMGHTATTTLGTMLFDKKDVNNILVEDILQKYNDAYNIVENHHSDQ